MDIDNCLEVIEQMLQQFKLVRGLQISHNAEEWEIYNEHYAGRYFENGFIVICTVGINTLNVGNYAKFVMHKKCSFSYKYLHNIQMMIVDTFMKDSQDICSVGIDVKENLVQIEVKDDARADSVIDKLTGFFENNDIKQDAVRIQKSKGITKFF